LVPLTPTDRRVFGYSDLEQAIASAEGTMRRTRHSLRLTLKQDR